MADPFVAEIRIFPLDFAPEGWASCDGQLLPVAQNQGLFTLLGTAYGGDGVETFALPDLRGSAPMHHGQGSGLSPRSRGDRGGSRTVTLAEAQVPPHTHALKASRQPGEDSAPGGAVLARSVGALLYRTAAGPDMVAMAPQALGTAGGAEAHDNLMPSLGLGFCIALQGVFPTPF